MIRRWFRTIWRVSGNNTDTYVCIHIIHILHYIVHSPLRNSIFFWPNSYPTSWTRTLHSISRLSRHKRMTHFITNRKTNSCCILLNQHTDSKNPSLITLNNAILYVSSKLNSTPSNCKALSIGSLAPYEPSILRIPTLCGSFNAFHSNALLVAACTRALAAPRALVRDRQHALPKPVVISKVRETHSRHQSWSLSFKLCRARTHFPPQFTSHWQSRSQHHSVPRYLSFQSVT